MARKLSNWLMGYREYTEGTESPEVFHLWVGIGVLCGAAQRKVYLDMDYFHVHSNMYLVLVSPPGRSRKSTALKIGKGILKGVPDYGHEVYFSTQASSVAAFIKQMSAIPNKEHQSLTAFVAGELGSLLGSKAVDMTDFLTDIYDCEPDWDKQTIGRGMEKIEKPWLNIMSATTPQWLGDNLSQTAVEGGFVARTIFIYEDTRKRVAMPQLTEEQKIIRKALIHDLAEVAALKGVFKFSPDALAYYKHWYENVLDAQAPDPRIATFLERKHIHMMKTAMALSMADNNSLIIQQRDVETAIGVLTELEPGMRRAFSAVGKNQHSTDIERIKSQIAEAGILTYKQILAANIHSVNKDDLDKIIHALVSMDEIEQIQGIPMRFRLKKGEGHARVIGTIKDSGDPGSGTDGHN